MGYCKISNKDRVVYRYSDTLETECEHPETKRQRCESEMAVKIECENANDAYVFSQTGLSQSQGTVGASPALAHAPASVPAPFDALALPPPPPLPVYVHI